MPAKFKRGDVVTHSWLPGRWIIESLAPTKGSYRLKATPDPFPTALAILLPHGMIELKVNDIRSWTSTEQDELK
jgi:hypothetical protein